MLQFYYSNRKGEAMKQSKLVRKLYQACLDHDTEKVIALRQKEFAKIFKHKAEGKAFDTKWHVVRV